MPTKLRAKASKASMGKVSTTSCTAACWPRHECTAHAANARLHRELLQACQPAQSRKADAPQGTALAAAAAVDLLLLLLKQQTNIHIHSFIKIQLRLYFSICSAQIFDNNNVLSPGLAAVRG
jgi:hypothetical protein